MVNPASNTNLIDKKAIEIPDDSLNTVRNNFLGKFKHLLKTPFFNEFYISRALFKGRHIDNPTIENEYFIGYYFMKVFNRTSENIENFFGDKEIELLTQMIGESYNYINSNTYLWLDGCIQAFNELKSDPDFFRQVSKERDYDKYRDLVSSKYSEKVTKIIDFSSEYDTDDKLFKIYSFWVRRYNEGNADVVLQF